MRRVQWGVVAICVAGLLVACSEGGGTPQTPAGAAPGATTAPAATAADPGAPAAPATVTPIDAGVEVKKGDSEFVAITATTEVEAGDVVRTDGTGFAEINYPDGSITRLDVDTEFRVVSITDDAGVATTRAELDGGRVWNRVQDLGTEGEFSIDTAVGVATVRGTAWVADCRADEQCDFTVFEGEVGVRPTSGPTVGLTAPFTMSTDGSDTTTPTPVPFDEAFADLWLMENAARDAEAGYDSAEEMYEAFGPMFASFDGQYDGSGAIGPVEECAPPADCSSAVGSSYTFDYVFSVACDGFMQCVRSVDMTFTRRGVTSEERATVVFLGYGYGWTLDLGGNGCSAANPGAVAFTLTPLAAVKTGGKWVITEVRLDAVPAPGKNCAAPPTTTQPLAPPDTTTPVEEPDECDTVPEFAFDDEGDEGNEGDEVEDDCVADECEIEGEDDSPGEGSEFAFDDEVDENDEGDCVPLCDDEYEEGDESEYDEDDCVPVCDDEYDEGDECYWCADDECEWCGEGGCEGGYPSVALAVWRGLLAARWGA